MQPWTPLTNDDTVQFLLDDPSRVSDALNEGWQTYSGLLATAIKAALGKSDLVADGVTFYDIDYRITPDQDLTAQANTLGRPEKFGPRIDYTSLTHPNTTELRRRRRGAAPEPWQSLE